MRKIISILLSMTLALAIFVPRTALAVSGNTYGSQTHKSDNSTSTVYDVEIEGVTYTVSISSIDRTRTVTVEEANSDTTTVVTIEGDLLRVYGGEKAEIISSIDLAEANTSDQNGYSTTATTTATKTSLYWDYSYYYSNRYYSTYGMYFKLKCGDEGSWSGYDYKNTEARSLAYDYCASVRALDTAQVAATAACGTAAVSIAAGIASAAPTGGVGAIIGVVAAVVSGVASVTEWVTAWNASLDCNQLFLQFKQAL